MKIELYLFQAGQGDISAKIYKSRPVMNVNNDLVFHIITLLLTHDIFSFLLVRIH